MREFFAERLRLAAEHAGVEYSPTAIARDVGVSKQTVHCWMTNTLPRADMVFRIADLWHVDARWLACGVGEMTPPPDKGSKLSAYDLELLKNARRARPTQRPSILAMVKTLAKMAAVVLFVGAGTTGFNNKLIAAEMPQPSFDNNGSEYTLRRFVRFLLSGLVPAVSA